MRDLRKLARYGAGTMDLELRLVPVRCGKLVLDAYVDSDWAGQPDRKSLWWMCSTERCCHLAVEPNQEDVRHEQCSGRVVCTRY
jgi:hypothetical protein